jgi:renal tumor antigen
MDVGNNDDYFLVEYRLIRKLGEGTFSEVIKAESTKTRQKVAIKCMKSVFNSVE